jgi:hypothetical protein
MTFDQQIRLSPVHPELRKAGSGTLPGFGVTVLRVVQDPIALIRAVVLVALAMSVLALFMMQR